VNTQIRPWCASTCKDELLCLLRVFIGTLTEEGDNG